MKLVEIMNIESSAWKTCYLDMGIPPYALDSLHVPHRLEVLHTMALEACGLSEDDEVSLYSSPGRFVLLGEFMEPLGGNMIGGTVGQDILAVVRYRKDSKCSLASWGYEETFHIDIEDGYAKQNVAGLPSAFLSGMSLLMQEEGAKLFGCDICIHSLIPAGMGLSSSSAFALLVYHVFAGHPDAILPKTLSDHQITRLAMRCKQQFYGRTAAQSDLELCLGGPLQYLHFGNGTLISKKIQPLRLLQDYSIFLVETWEAFDDEEDEREELEKELAELALFMEKRSGKSFFENTSENTVALFPEIRESCGERVILRGLYMLEENNRIALAQKALDSIQGIGTLLELINISTATAYRQLQNIWPESHPVARGLALGIELTERWLRSVGMPGAVHVHGHGFYGSFYALVPRNMGSNYRQYIENFFGPDSAKELFLRTKGCCRIM